MKILKNKSQIIRGILSFQSKVYYSNNFIKNKRKTECHYEILNSSAPIVVYKKVK